MLYGVAFVTSKPVPGDLDYSIVVSVSYGRSQLAESHQRLFVPYQARQFYGVGSGYLVLRDWPMDIYNEQMDFLCRRRGQSGDYRNQLARRSGRMSIENDRPLREAYETVVGIYRLRDRIEKDITGNPEGRADQLAGIEAMSQRIERQIATYLASRGADPIADKAA